MVALTSRLERAIRVAATAHRHHMRKVSTTPYIIHPYSVMLLASTDTDDEDTLIACLFHDILEDVPEHYPRQTMLSEFGERVTRIVEDVSKDDQITDWRQRSEAYLDHLENAACNEAVLVSLADKTHNLLSTLHDYREIGPAVWDRFNSSEAQQLWWYQSIQDITRQRQPNLSLHSRYKDYVDTLQRILTTSSEVE